MIKSAVFDFSGVLFTYNYRRYLELIADEMQVSSDYVYAHIKPFQHAYERGEITEDVFWSGLAEELGATCDRMRTHNRIMDQYKPIPETLEILDELKRDHLIVLLSNHTNWIHELDQRYKFLDRFDKRIISCDVGHRKPEPQMFEILIEYTGLLPDEHVYTDDTKKYLEAADKMGIKTILFTNPQQLRSDLVDMGV